MTDFNQQGMPPTPALVPGEAGRASGTERETARRRLQAQRWLRELFASFVVVNAVLVVVWGLTGAGYFWPGWIMGVWGAGLVLQAWITYRRQPISEADVDAELRRRQ